MSHAKKIIKIGQCFTKLFKKIKVARFYGPQYTGCGKKVATKVFRSFLSNC